MLQYTRFFVLLFLTAGCASNLTSRCHDLTVAAFDIGSGSTKIKVAQKDSCTHEITKEFMETSLPVAYSDDLTSSKKFSEEIAHKGEEAIRTLLQSALEYNPELILGVATQAFREAENGEELLERFNKKFGFSFEVIDQEKEAELAYQLIVAKFKDQLRDRLVVWDIGGGSQQLISKVEDKETLIFKSQLASVSFKNQVIKKIKKRSTSTPNPLSKQELQQARSLVASEVDKMMDKKLRSILLPPIQVIGLGGVHGQSVKKQLKLKDGERVQIDKLKKLVDEKVGQDDKELGGSYASTQLTNLILIEGLMKKYGITSYLPVSTSLTEALIRLP